MLLAGLAGLAADSGGCRFAGLAFAERGFWMLKRSALPVATTAILIGAILIAAAAAAGEGPPLSGSVGDFSRIDPPLPAPADSFKDANGDRLALADFHGKLVLLNLWATWCGPCRQEMPSLDRLEAKLSGEGLVVLPISIDQGGGPVVAMYYYQEGIDHLGIYLDPSHDIQDRLKVDALPTSFLIDRQGRLVGTLEGSTQWDSPEAIALIRYYLKGPKAPAKTPVVAVPAAFRAPVENPAPGATAQRVGMGLSPL